MEKREIITNDKILNKCIITNKTIIQLSNSIKKIKLLNLKKCENLKKVYLPKDLEDINHITINKDVLNEYKGGYYLGTKNNPHLWLISISKKAKKIIIHKECRGIAKRFISKINGPYQVEEIIIHNKIKSSLKYSSLRVNLNMLPKLKFNVDKDGYKCLGNDENPYIQKCGGKIK